MLVIRPTPVNPTPVMMVTSPESGSNIILNAGSEEMLKITETGFYVRGVRVPADDNEARAVYNCFKQWMAWASLTQKN